MKRLIDVKELFEIMNSDKKFVILDCRFDLMNKTYGVDSYNKGHIKGSYLVDVENDLTDKVGEHGGRHPFKNHDEFIKIVENFGIDNETTVITYDDGDMQGAGRLVFQLNNIGLKNAYALDGGITAYKKQGGVIESEKNTPSITESKLNVKIDDSFMVSMEYVKSKLYDENTIIVDSRSNPRYLGLEEPVDKKAGHVPSAKNFFFMDVLDLENIEKSSFKNKEFLMNHYKELVENKDKEIILYCGSGISLMVNALALDIIDVPYKIYPGSFSDWISYDENEIMTDKL